MNLNNFAHENVTKLNSITNAIRETDGSAMPYLHWHPHYELLLIASGDCIINSNNNELHTDKPGLYIHRPYTLHKLNAKAGVPYKRCVIGFSRKISAQLSENLLDMSVFMNADLVYVQLNESELSELWEQAVKLHRYLYTEGEIDFTLSLLSLAFILQRVILILASGRGEAVSSCISYIQDALQFVSDKLSEPQTVEQLSVRYQVGQSKFHDDFKATTGSTYKKYMTDLRLNRALELLSGGMSIINTALEVGYSSEAHFIKAFREYWNMTPGQYLRGQLD